MQSLLRQFETDSIPDDAGVAGEGRTASVDSIGPRIETHWTRIFYRDLFNAEPEDAPSETDTLNRGPKIMRTSTELQSRAAFDEPAVADAEARGEAPLFFLWREPASNDAAHVDLPSSREPVEAWARHAVAANGFGATPEVVALTKPGAWDVHEAARAQRAYALGEIMVALMAHVADVARAVAARWAQRRRARAIHAAFSELDDHMLRDLGLHRSEIGSLAAEVTGDAERTRKLALLTRNGFLM